MKAKSDNRRALPKFLIIIFISGIVGGVLGFLTSFFGFSGALEAAALAVNSVLKAASFYGIPACAVVLLGSGWLLYFQAKSRFNAWDGEDEAVVEGIERTLDWCLLWSAVYQVLDFFLFGAGCVYYKDDRTMRMLWIVGFFLISMAVNIVLQQKVVDLEKRMNPEKRGSVYDPKFQKKWMDSCDEAEQRQIGQACYAAYRVTGNVCIGLWLVLMLLDFVYDIGILPQFSVMLIWGVMQVAYVLASMKLEHKSKGVRAE